MSKAISVNDELVEQYGIIATMAHVSWEDFFREALEYALPEMQRRYAPCPACNQIPRKRATFCDNCGVQLQGVSDKTVNKKEK
jgi:hypothetical protein